MGGRGILVGGRGLPLPRRADRRRGGRRHAAAAAADATMLPRLYVYTLDAKPQ